VHFFEKSSHDPQFFQLVHKYPPVGYSNPPAFISWTFSSMRPLSTDIKDSILSLLSQGKSDRYIEKQVQISRTSVRNTRQRYPSNYPRPLDGRPPELSVQDKRVCVRSITSGKQKSAPAVRKYLKDHLDIQIGDNTVRRALKEAGLRAMEKQKKPKLSPKNIKAQLEFAKSHRDWTTEDWKRVIWSDETKISRFGSDGRSWCWIGDGEDLQEHHVKQVVKHGGGSVMIWGCMTSEGPGFMCKMEGTMDQHLYRSILEGELVQTINWYEFDSTKVIFQQDNDPKHRSRTVMDWLNQQEFDTLEWPAQSPDLNPIEHLWAGLKRRLNEYEHPPTGMLELWERIEDEWNKIDKKTCLRLIESMPERIRAVLRSKGK
jgi:transposase